eukprot:SAG11_NODE_2596_length_3183_cov_12.191310_3_plen_121_part_00
MKCFAIFIADWYSTRPAILRSPFRLIDLCVCSVVRMQVARCRCSLERWVFLGLLGWGCLRVRGGPLVQAGDGRLRWVGRGLGIFVLLVAWRIRGVFAVERYTDAVVVESKQLLEGLWGEQ